MKATTFLLVFAATLFPNPALGSRPINHIDPNEPTTVRQTSPKLEKALANIQETIGYKFRDVSLLELALRRNAYDIGHSQPSLGYDRLAFLGDKFLKLFIRDKLWREYHKYSELKARDISSKILRNETFGDLNRELRLTVAACDSGLCHAPKLNPHDQGDHIESLFGALYYDGGFPACTGFFRKYFSETSVSSVIQALFHELREHYKPFRRQRLTEDELQKNEQSWSTFLGEALLDLAVSDFLCARFPLKGMGELTQDNNVLLCSANLDHLLQSINNLGTKAALTTYLSSLFLESDYKSVYNYVSWQYTSPGVPEKISSVLNKTATDEEAYTYIEKPDLVMGPPRTILDQLMMISGRKVLYEPVEKSGPDHMPLFNAVVTCEGHFSESAKANTKSEAEGLACQKALRQLASRFMVFALSDHVAIDGNLEHWTTAKAILEWQLYDIGFKRFSYFPLGILDSGNQVLYRHEIQGPGISPVRGQGCSPQESKARGLAACLRSVLVHIPSVNREDLREEDIYRELEAITEGKRLIEYRDPVNLLLQICSLTDIDLQSRVAKRGQDNAPTFLFDLKGPFFQQRGKGKTKVEAKTAVAMDALERLKASWEAHRLSGAQDFSQGDGKEILDLITSWSNQSDKMLTKAALDLKSPRAMAVLSIQKIWLLHQALFIDHQNIKVVSCSKSGGRQLQNITLSLAFSDQRYEASGSRVEFAFLGAIYEALKTNRPHHGALEICNPLLHLLGIKTTPPRKLLNAPDNNGLSKGSKASTKTKKSHSTKAKKPSAVNRNGKKK